MAKESKADGMIIGLLIVVGTPILATEWLYENAPWALVLIAVLVIAGIIGYIRYNREKLRLFDPRAVDVWALSPVEYEQYCATILQKFGWKTRLTKASGDHGVDVVAEMGPTRVAIQVKQYRNRVGNAAVQQVVAGKAVYQCAAAVCVAPSGFTQGALTLAQANGVLLLRHLDLPDLHIMLGVKAP